MRRSIFITGATGLLGANICDIAVRDGREVRALVRTESDASRLRKAGVEPVLGDLSDPSALTRAIGKAEAVIHAAALIGGTWAKASFSEFMEVNYIGVCNVLEAAKAAGVERSLVVSTIGIFDASITMTESAHVLQISPGDSPYTQAKRASYYDCMLRACLGQNLGFLVPAGIYGPSSNLERALADTSFDRLILRGIKGEITEYVDFPMNWVFAEDAARVALAGLDDDTRGGRYLAAGRGEDECSVASCCNMAAEIAGSPHRVANRSLAQMKLDVGAMAAMSKRIFAKPMMDGGVTQKLFGIEPTPLKTGLERTVEWMRGAGVIGH